MIKFIFFSKYPVFLRRNVQKYYSWNHEGQGDFSFERNISHYALTKTDTTLLKQDSENLKPKSRKKIILRKDKNVFESDNNAIDTSLYNKADTNKASPQYFDPISQMNDLNIRSSKSDNNFHQNFNENKIRSFINPNANSNSNTLNKNLIDMNFSHNQTKFEINYNSNIDTNTNEYNLNQEYKAVSRNIDLEDLKNKYNETTSTNQMKIKKVFRRGENSKNAVIDVKFLRRNDEVLIKEEDFDHENKLNSTEYNKNRLFLPEIIPSNSLYYYKFSENEMSDTIQNNKNIILGKK